MRMFEEETLRIRATEAWLAYLKVVPESDVDIYDFHQHYQYSYEEIREIFLKAASTGEHLSKDKIYPRKSYTGSMPSFD